jgi:hypothetical protein
MARARIVTPLIEYSDNLANGLRESGFEVIDGTAPEALQTESADLELTVNECALEDVEALTADRVGKRGMCVFLTSPQVAGSFRSIDLFVLKPRLVTTPSAIPELEQEFSSLPPDGKNEVLTGSQDVALAAESPSPLDSFQSILSRGVQLLRNGKESPSSQSYAALDEEVDQLVPKGIVGQAFSARQVSNEIDDRIAGEEPRKEEPKKDGITVETSKKESHQNDDDPLPTSLTPLAPPNVILFPMQDVIVDTLASSCPDSSEAVTTSDTRSDSLLLQADLPISNQPDIQSPRRSKHLWIAAIVAASFTLAAIGLMLLQRRTSTTLSSAPNASIRDTQPISSQSPSLPATIPPTAPAVPALAAQNSQTKHPRRTDADFVAKDTFVDYRHPVNNPPKKPHPDGPKRVVVMN